MYGADAVFIGGKEFSLRSQASNFTIEDIKEAVKIAKSYKGKIYVTCNIVAHNNDLINPQEFKDFLGNYNQKESTHYNSSLLLAYRGIKHSS